jgi:hypothetical protein
MKLPIAKTTTHSFDPHTLYAVLCRKELEIKQVQKEIAALASTILLLADDENELSRSSPRRLKSETRAINQPGPSAGLHFRQSYNKTTL